MSNNSDSIAKVISDAVKDVENTDKIVSSHGVIVAVIDISDAIGIPDMND